MLLDEIKSRMFKAMKEGRNVEKEILRVAVGEITTQAARDGGSGGDEQALGILRKLIKSNEESLALMSDPTKKSDLELENRTLAELLPSSLSVDEIIEQLSPMRAAIASAANAGQATGVAMKHLKSVGANVSGKDVAAAVQRVRETKVGSAT